MATSEPGRPDGPRRLGLAHCGTPRTLHFLVTYPEERQDLEAFPTNELIDDCNSYEKERIRRWRASGNGAEGGLPRPGRKNLGGGGRSDIMDRVHWMLGGFVYT